MATASMNNACLVRPNKPMVPTAPNWPDEDSLDPLRRHIGRPFDAERRA
jgi:hypothetical protein